MNIHGEQYRWPSFWAHLRASKPKYTFVSTHHQKSWEFAPFWLLVCLNFNHVPAKLTTFLIWKFKVSKVLYSQPLLRMQLPSPQVKFQTLFCPALLGVPASRQYLQLYLEQSTAFFQVCFPILLKNTLYWVSSIIMVIAIVVVYYLFLNQVELVETSNLS
jgi:hypothetical protein